VIGAALVLCPVLVAQQAEPRRIATAPAFNARALTSNPTKDWITNGGNVFNQRYSPLTLLDRSNVKDLKALWRTGMGTGAAPNNSGQAQILHHQGTLFVINGANDVFALDVDSGAILWTYRGNPDQRAGVPMGRSSRGVTMGEGKIFVGLNDARLVALDQRTGEVVWSVEAERWQNGFSITSAPLYYDGMVITRRPSIPRSTSSISRPVIRAPICTAACGPATTCSASRSLPSTRTRENIAGTSSRFITTSGTTTRRIPSCCSMRRSTA